MTTSQSLIPGETCFNLNFSNPGGYSLTAADLRSMNNGSSDSSDPTSSSAAVLNLFPGNFGNCLKSGSVNGSSPSSGKSGCSEESGSVSGSGSGSISGKHSGILNGNSGMRRQGPNLGLPNGKKTKGRVKIPMNYIANKLRRYTTFSKRKTGIMKKAHELATLTGTQVLLVVASETGHVYNFATPKLRPMIQSETGKTLIMTCLNAPDFKDDASNIGSVVSESKFCEPEMPPFEKQTSKRKKHSQQSPHSFHGDEDILFKDSTKWARSPSNLPTMVPHCSSFSSRVAAAVAVSSNNSLVFDECDDNLDEDNIDDDDIDEDGSESAVAHFMDDEDQLLQDQEPEPKPDRRQLTETQTSFDPTPTHHPQVPRSSNGSKNTSATTGSTPKLTPAQQGAVMAQQAATLFKLPGQFLFPGFIPTTSGSTTPANVAQSFAGFNLMSGLTNGALMYQMPQGVVYAPNTMQVDGSQQNFMFASFPQTADHNGQPTQPLIIPVPFPMPPSAMVVPKTETAAGSDDDAAN